MLKMRKYFIGLALVATLFAGCKTAQKSDFASDWNISQEDMDASYAATDASEASRNPASLGPILSELSKALQAAPITKAFATAGKESRNISQELVTFVNRIDSPQITKLKNEKFAAAEKKWKAAGSPADSRPQRGRADRLEGNDFNKINVDDQARIAKQFMDEKALKDFPSLNGIYKKVDAEVTRLAKADATKTNLTGDMKTKIETDQFGNTRNIHDKVNANASAAKLEAEVEEVIALLAKNDPAFNAADARATAKKILVEARKDSGRIYQLTGNVRSFTIKTCDNLSLDALDRYGQLLKEIREELEKYEMFTDAKGYRRLACKNGASIAAWAAGKFQERLGRTGLAALIAVEEMSICNFLDANVSKASQDLRVANKGVLPPDAPKCVK